MKREIDAVVAAGGFGRRFGSALPKSLQIVGEKPLIAHTLRSLMRAGVRRIVVCIDRPEWESAVREHCGDVPGVKVLCDPGYSSTFLLMKHALIAVGPTFLFVYGHAPRPPAHIAELMTSRSTLCATGTWQSSKRAPLLWRPGLFLEPPYLLAKRLLVGTKVSSWSEFFELNRQRVSICEVGGPSEFNYSSEFNLYERYLLGFSA